jgi:hypothetical protein
LEARIEELQAEFVDLLQKQVQALELESYVGLTDAEWRQYHKRQDRLRDVEASLFRDRAIRAA